MRQQQISQAKTDVDQPMIDALRTVLDESKSGQTKTSNSKLIDTISKFAEARVAEQAAGTRRPGLARPVRL